jgi:hypothetical protein
MTERSEPDPVQNRTGSATLPIRENGLKIAEANMSSVLQKYEVRFILSRRNAIRTV